MADTTTNGSNGHAAGRVVRVIGPVVVSAIRHSPEAADRASAPPTISMVSVVISSWRARLACRVWTLMSSSALSVAAFIARRRAAFSDAADSSSAA